MPRVLRARGDSEADLRLMRRLDEFTCSGRSWAAGTLRDKLRLEGIGRRSQHGGT